MTTTNTAISTPTPCSLFHRKPGNITVRQARAMRVAGTALALVPVVANDAQDTMRKIIADQIETINCATENIQGALDEHAQNSKGRPLTWVDVSGLQQLVDSLTRAELI